jgi:hypothetical protein
MIILLYFFSILVKEKDGSGGEVVS